jgi:hypothetical protein
MYRGLGEPLNMQSCVSEILLADAAAITAGI